MTMISTLGRLALTGALVLAPFIGTAWAQTAPPPSSTDARWAPWLGCWQLVEETVSDREAELLALIGLDAAPKTRARGPALICATPAPNSSGVTMSTLINDQTVLTETIVADGSQRTLTEPDCQGWQRADWSARAPRLYARAEIACAGQPTRTVSGLAMLIAGPTWIDVQMIESEGRKNLRVRRYARAADQKHAGTIPAALRDAARQPLTTRLTVADVQEANAKVAPEALQAAILEMKAPFDLNGRQLVALSEAGVPPSVIDLMVALTFPKKFVVERASGGGSWSSWSSAGFDDYWPWYADPYFYTSYYAPFGYRYWGRYDPYYFSGPGFVVIDPETRPGEIQPSGQGRVVDGRGYTRVTTRQPDSQDIGNGRGWGGASTNGGNSGSSSSGSGSSGVSSGGYSSGGGGGGGRTAQPRPPGGE